MTADQTEWLWTPHESIGPYRFGEPVDRNQHALKPVPESSPERERFYVVGKKLILSCRKGRLVQAECWGEVKLDAVPLMGMSVGEAKALMPGSWERKSDDHYHSHALGIDLWLEDNVIASVTLWGPEPV